MMILLAVTMLVLGSCGWLLWSFLVEIICQDTEKNACVNKDLILDILLFLEDPKYPLAADSKSDNCVGCNYARRQIKQDGLM